MNAKAAGTSATAVIHATAGTLETGENKIKTVDIAANTWTATAVGTVHENYCSSFQNDCEKIFDQ